MAAKRGRKKKVVNALSEAIGFVSLAQKASGLPYQQHTRIADGYAIATDGVLTAGFPVATDVTANAHTKTLKSALAKCGEQFSITHQTNGTLKVSSGGFSAVVPCLPEGEMLPVASDPNIAVVGSSLTDGLGIVSQTVTESGPKVAYSSVMVQSGSLVATNGLTLAEYWHGIDLPPGMLWPKSFVAVLLKTGKAPIGFGYGGESVTIHFEDGSFIKTQLYNEAYPDIGRILNVETRPWPLPVGLAEACLTLADFTPDGAVYATEGLLGSHPNPQEGATVEVEGVPPGTAFGVGDLNGLIPHLDTVDFSHQNVIYFYGDNIRVAIAKRKS